MRLRRCGVALRGMAALLALLPGLARAVETQASAHGDVGGGYDSNVGRDLDGLAQGDGLMVGVLQLQGGLAAEDGPAALGGSYELGAKHFFTLSDQDLLAQGASLEGSTRLGPVGLGLAGRAKDRRSRGGERDYSDLNGGVLATWRLGKAPLRLDAGLERFYYRPDPAYRFGGPVGALSATVPLVPRHRLIFTATGALRAYDPASRDATAANGNCRPASSRVSITCERSA